MSQENVALIQGIYEAFAAGDVPTVLGAMSPTIEWLEAENFIYADGNPYIGPEAVLNGVFMRCVTEWEGFTVTPEAFHDAGDTVIVTGRYTGRNNATGKPLNAQMAHFWTLQDGKVVRYRQLADTLQTFQAANK